MKGPTSTLARGGRAIRSRHRSPCVGTPAGLLAGLLATAAIGWAALAGERTSESAVQWCPVAPEEHGRVVVIRRVRPAEAAAGSAVTSERDLPRSSSEAFRDPATGRFVEPAPDQLLESGPQRLSAAVSTSAEGLVEEPVAASPGGVRVSLRGRFRSATFAARHPDGSLAVECGEPADSAVEAPVPPAPPTASTAGGAR